MKTTFRIRQPYADIFRRCSDEFVCNSPVKPVRFIEKMQHNTGMSGGMFGITDEKGLEKKNPLIVALGDSVTAGHFESLMTPETAALLGKYFGALNSGADTSGIKEALLPDGNPPAIEIFDARESYIEKFREKLIDKYELTSVSVINSGIAGDILPSMAARAERDVIRYQPDLILVNASLNWDDGAMGDEKVYKEMLRDLIRRFKTETEADIILITPNGDLPNAMFSAPGQGVPEPTTYKRAEAIRELAEEESVCLADARAVWDAAAEAGCPWSELLANGINHPSAEGHEIYAEVLMKLFD